MDADGKILQEGSICMSKRLSLDDLIEQLISLRDSTKRSLQVSVLLGDEAHQVVSIRIARRGVELIVTEMHTDDPPPTRREIAAETERIRQQWDFKEEHRRRGLTQSDVHVPGIRVCSSLGLSNFLGAIEDYVE